MSMVDPDENFTDAFEEVFDELRGALVNAQAEGLTLEGLAREQPIDRMTKASTTVTRAVASDDDEQRLELLAEAAVHLCVAIRIALNRKYLN